MDRRRLTLLTTVTAVSVALVPGTALADTGGGGRSAPTPGAPGIGDPYYPLDGNGGYDVEHYDLDLRYDPATDVLSGTATVAAQATQALSAFDLDLQGLEVQSVTVDGRPATWTRDGGELVITPARPVRAGHGFTTVVAYEGVPQTQEDELGAYGFFHTDDGAVVAGEPDGADTWFPANDHPLDAASLDVTITVPAGLEAVSNGQLAGQHTQDGWTTWRWCAGEPMATYLATLAIGEFDLRSYVADGVRYWDALDPDLFAVPGADGGPSAGQVAEDSLARQPEMIEYLAGFFGPYPFRAAGGIVVDAPELGFALETQTRPIYPASSFPDPTSGDLVVLHELTHQWTGDLVRLARWQDIWLNEGFATYAEWLWAEHEGRVTVQEQFDENAALPADDPFWSVAPGDPGATADRLFSDAVYTRGAMTLHVLRLAVGDDVMRQIVRDWTSTYAGQAVTTEDFIALAEADSGQQLDDLFRTWLYTPGKPAVLG
jgi:aminopeptidase N